MRGWIGQWSGWGRPGAPGRPGPHLGGASESLSSRHERPGSGKRRGPRGATTERRLTSFIGRERELDEVCALLERPDCRLLSLVGPGGIGKTRLAMEVADRAPQHFADGARVVPLQALPGPDDLVPAIADTIGVRITRQDNPVHRLAELIADKEQLIVLDNFEHLLGAASLLPELLSCAPSIKLLVTSREVLSLEEEWLYHVEGMAVPSDTAADAAGFAAVQLFEQRALQVSRHFNLAEALPDVARICRLVEGMPLAVELAASWVKYLSPREVAAEIESSLDFLETNLRNVPEGHRQMRAVFDQSWQRLDEDQRSAFARLSVFAGDFSREATEKVAGASLPLVASLVDKSLVRQVAPGRFTVHELLRQFGRAQLTERGELDAIVERHGEYFLQWLATRAGDMQGGRQPQATTEIAAELANVRLAWEWAVARGREQLIERTAETLHEFFQYCSRYLEGATIFQEAIERLPAGEATPERASAETRLLVPRAWFAIRLGDVETATTMLERAVALADEHGLIPPNGLATDPRAPQGIVEMIHADFERAVHHGSAARERAERFGSNTTSRSLATSWGKRRWPRGSTRTPGSLPRRALPSRRRSAISGSRPTPASSWERSRASAVSSASPASTCRPPTRSGSPSGTRREWRSPSATSPRPPPSRAITPRRSADSARASPSIATWATAAGSRPRSWGWAGSLAAAATSSRRMSHWGGPWRSRDEMQFVSLLFEVLEAVGELLVKSGDTAAAVELLAFVASQESAPHAVRAAVEARIEEAAAGLPKAEVAAARRRAGEHDLSAILSAVRKAMEGAGSGETAAKRTPPTATVLPSGETLGEREVEVCCG